MQKLTIQQKMIIAAAVVIVLGVSGYFFRKYFHPSQPVTYYSQQQAENPYAVRQAAENGGTMVNQEQAVAIAQQIEHIATSNEKPDKIVETTGAELANTIEAEQRKSGADFSLVADPGHPNTNTTAIVKQMPQIPVTLHQYNIKAYPDKLIEGTIYTSGDFDIGCMNRVKVFGTFGYIGPVIQSQNKNIRVGVRVSIPL